MNLLSGGLYEEINLPLVAWHPPIFEPGRLQDWVLDYEKLSNWNSTAQVLLLSYM